MKIIKSLLIASICLATSCSDSMELNEREMPLFIHDKIMVEDSVYKVIPKPKTILSDYRFKQ